MCSNNTKELEQKRIKSEIERNEAERQKFLSETKEINKRVNAKVWSQKNIVQAAIAGIVLAGLLAAWIVGYFKPILSKNQELATLDNKILTAENKRQRQFNEIKKRELDKLKEQATIEMQQLNTQNSELQEQQQGSVQLIKDLKNKLESISKEYEKLSKRYEATESERKKYSDLALSARKELDSLKGEQDRLKAASVLTEVRSRTLSDRIIASTLTNTRWTLHLDSTTPLFDIVFHSGGILVVPIKPNTTHRWFVKDSELTLELSDGFAVYKSKVEDPNFLTLEGHGINKKGMSWNWTATPSLEKK